MSNRETVPPPLDPTQLLPLLAKLQEIAPSEYTIVATKIAQLLVGDESMAGDLARLWPILQPLVDYERAERKGML